MIGLSRHVTRLGPKFVCRGVGSRPALPPWKMALDIKNYSFKEIIEHNYINKDLNVYYQC